MELEEPPLGAAATLMAHEGAPAAVAEPDRAFDLGRNVPRARGGAATPTRAVRGGELLPGQVGQQRRQRPIDDRPQIPIRDLVPQEGLRERELFVRLGARRELHLVTLGRQWGDDRRTRWKRRGYRRRQGWGGDGLSVAGRLGAGRRISRGRWPGRRVAGGRDRRLGAQPRDECLDLPLARVPGHGEQVPMVLGREVRREQPHRREGHRALSEPLQDDREPPGGPGGLDAPVGGVLGEVEDLRTVREQRRAAFGQVCPPHVQFREVRNQGRRRLPLALSEPLHPREQFGVGELSHRGEQVRIHGSCIPWLFRTA